MLFFLYGFEKNDRDNISAKELALYQRFDRAEMGKRREKAKRCGTASALGDRAPGLGSSGVIRKRGKLALRLMIECERDYEICRRFPP